MTPTAETPETTKRGTEGGTEGDGRVADAVRRNWVDGRAPAWSRPWLRLSRADRPAGTWLLLLPCWWGLPLAMAADQPRWIDLWLYVSMAIGAFLMRGAGCTWNDITDRHFDAQVARTRSRPIPSGQVTATGAAIWMAVQALIACAILMTYNKAAITLGVLSLLPVAVYPFAKRFTWWPQVFLGIAFNWGALMGWVAHAGQLNWAPVLLYLGGISWTLFYDTIYAHQDKEDDALIGIKSTARLFAEDTPRWLRRFATVTVALMTLAVLAALGGSGHTLSLVIALGAPLAMALHMAWQLRRLDIDDTDVCLALFRVNRDAGLLAALFLAVAALV